MCPVEDKLMLASPVQVQKGLAESLCSDMFLLFSQDIIPDFPYEPDAFDEELLR